MRSFLKIIAVLSMTASLVLLPVVERRWGSEHVLLSRLPEKVSILLFGLLLATIFLLSYRPAWARLPALLWLGTIAVLLRGLLERPGLHSEWSVSPAGWIAAFGGGALAVAVSLAERLRKSPADHSAFD